MMSSTRDLGRTGRRGFEFLCVQVKQRKGKRRGGLLLARHEPQEVTRAHDRSFVNQNKSSSLYYDTNVESAVEGKVWLTDGISIRTLRNGR